jgi:hypothetical protein
MLPSKAERIAMWQAHLHGKEHLQRALDNGKGVILWVFVPFCQTLADLNLLDTTDRSQSHLQSRYLKRFWNRETHYGQRCLSALRNHASYEQQAEWHYLHACPATR